LGRQIQDRNLGLPELSKVDDSIAIGPFSVVGSAKGDFGTV